MSTLAEELEIAALDADYIAAKLDSSTHRDRALRLRQRAAWVRELEQPAYLRSGYDVYRALSGPDIPAAAPTERKEP